MQQDPTVNGETTSYPTRERAAGDHDQAYTFGRPASTYLAPREVARLLILRSELRERRRLETADAQTSRPMRARGRRRA